MDDKDIDEIIENNQPQKKQLSDVLFSATDIITKIHNIRSNMIDAINDKDYLAQITPEQWALISDALTNAENVSVSFINAQARIAEKIPEVQQIFNTIAGQLSLQVQQAKEQVEGKTENTFEIPKEIIPIQQAIQSTMDSKFGIDRTKIIEGYITTNENMDNQNTENNNN